MESVENKGTASLEFTPTLGIRSNQDDALNTPTSSFNSSVSRDDINVIPTLIFTVMS